MQEEIPGGGLVSEGSGYNRRHNGLAGKLTKLRGTGIFKLGRCTRKRTRGIERTLKAESTRLFGSGAHDPSVDRRYNRSGRLAIS